MSDDLVKRLREGDHTMMLAERSANRIEELEAKLAKAVEALADTRVILAEFERHPFPVLTKVLTTLAELKGDTNE